MKDLQCCHSGLSGILLRFLSACAYIRKDSRRASLAGMTLRYLLAGLIITTPFLIASCRTPGMTSLPSDARIIGNVPFYEQEIYQCGPSALASVLNYWNIPVTPEQIAGEIFSKSARGTLNLDMILYAQGKGLYAEQYRGSVEKPENQYRCQVSL